MNTRILSPAPQNSISPEPFAPQVFTDATAAVDALTALYERNTNFLIEAFSALAKGGPIEGRYRAFYPQVSIETTSYGHVDDLCLNLLELSRLSEAHGEAFNITGEGCSSMDFVLELADIVGAEPNIVEVPTGFTDLKPIYGHLFGIKHHGILSVQKARDFGLTVERGFRTGYEQTYEWFCSTPLVDGPDHLSDPVWGAGYDFGLEAEVVAALGKR